MKINNSQLMSTFSLFEIKKLYFKLIFNSVSGNCDSFFSQISSDHRHVKGALLGEGGNWHGKFLLMDFCLGGLCSRTF